MLPTATIGTIRSLHWGSMPSSSPNSVQGENQHGPGRAGKGITLTGANHDVSILLNVNFFAWVPEPQSAAGDRRDHVSFVVYSGEMGDLGVKVCRPGRVTDPRRPERDASDRGSLREVKLHEERIEFRERSAERVTDLRSGKKSSRHGVPMGDGYFATSEATHEDDVGRSVLGHQTLHFREDLASRLLVLECKAGVDLDVAGNVGKEVGVRVHEFEVHVS